MRNTSPDDRWVANADVYQSGLVDDDLEDRSASIRYIDFVEHPQLSGFFWMLKAVHGKKATFIVRDEYVQLIQHALTKALSSVVRMFITGHSGTGKSLGTHYFLMYLLGLGKSVFWVVDNYTYYFNSHGVQYRGHNTLPGLCEVFNALKTSCVIIDVGQADWIHSAFSISKFVLCTSTSRESRWQSFRKHFVPTERWFMKPWSTKEIAAAADRLGSAHEEVIFRMKWCGPDPRHLFIGKPQTDQQLRSDIIRGLSGPGKFGVDDSLFLVRPAVVTDNSGERRLVRHDFVSEFLTPALAAMTVELAANHINRLQPSLSWALYLSSTRRVAGRFIERVMHRSLTSGTLSLPAVLGSGRVAATSELLGQADVYTLKGVPTTQRPLYLRPLASFPAVDAMVAVSPRQLALLLTSLDDIDTTTFSTILPIIERLSIGAGVDVEGLEDIIYCLVGTGGDADRVRVLVRKARSTLTQLQKMDRELPATARARMRIMSFRVVGVTFDHETGFTDVTRD